MSPVAGGLKRCALTFISWCVTRFNRNRNSVSDRTCIRIICEPTSDCEIPCSSILKISGCEGNLSTGCSTCLKICYTCMLKGGWRIIIFLKRPRQITGSWCRTLSCSTLWYCCSCWGLEHIESWWSWCWCSGNISTWRCICHSGKQRHGTEMRINIITCY